MPARKIIRPGAVQVQSIRTRFSGEIAEILKQIEKQYGSGVAHSASITPLFNVIPTGVFMLDVALSGGYAQGTPTQIYGWENNGKTTLVMKAVAAAQVKDPDKFVVWVDVENSFDKGWAQVHGVNTDDLVIVKPDSGENAVDIITSFAHCKEVSMIVLDSIPTLVPQKEIDDSATDALVAVRARLVGRMCSKLGQSFLTERKRNHWMTFISINQFRHKIGVVKGDTRTLPGGMQQNYFHSQKIELKGKEKVNEAGHALHMEHEFLIKKAKNASLRSGEFEMGIDPHYHLGQGAVDEGRSIAAYAKRYGILTEERGRGKIQYRVPQFDQVFDGREDLEASLGTNRDLADWLKLAIIMKHRALQGMPPLPPDGYLVSHSAPTLPVYDDGTSSEDDDDDRGARIIRPSLRQVTKTIRDRAA